MTSVFLYTFIFSTWGLGLLSWIIGLSNFIANNEISYQEKYIEISQKKALLNRFNNVNGIQIPGSKSQSLKNTPWGRVGEKEESPELIPEKIKELMKSSPNHPEVKEIDSTDQILGVKFEAGNYPPVFGDGDEDE